MRNCKRCCTNEESIRDDVLRFDSFIFHSIEYIEVIKGVKRFLPMALPSKVMGILLKFRFEILPICRPNGP